MKTDKPWFNLWPPEVPKHIDYPRIPLQEILQKTAEVCSEKTALICGERLFTYAQLELLSNQFANALAQLGVKKGDRVAIFLPNIPQFVIAFFGVLKSGAVATTISPLHREREVEYQLSDSGAQTVVALDSLFPVLEADWAKTQVENVILTSLNESSENSIPNRPNIWSYQQLLKNAPKTRPKTEINPSEDLAVLQYTGGTTGTAKGAMLTHTNLVSNALCLRRLDKRHTSQRNIPDSPATIPYLRHDHKHDCSHRFSCKNDSNDKV